MVHLWERQKDKSMTNAEVAKVVRRTLFIYPQCITEKKLKREHQSGVEEGESQLGS